MRIDSNKIEKVNYELRYDSNKNVNLDNKEKNKNEDVFEFNISAKEINEFFDLAKKEEKEREIKINLLKEQYLKGEYNIKGNDVISKMLGEK